MKPGHMDRLECYPTMQEIETVQLQLQEYGAKYIIDHAILRDTFAYPAYFSAVYNQALDQMVFSIVQGIYGRTFAEIKVTYPDGWWQVVKKRFFPKWLLLFSPIKWKVQKINADELYPMISMPGNRPVIRVYKEDDYGPFGG